MVMKQNIINARITFKKSPIHVLEKFAFKDMPNACLTFKKNSSVSECVIIQTIKTFGAVSEKVVLEMVIGVASKSHSDIAVSITGVAGPTGGTPEKPVGMVCFGFSYDGKTSTSTQLFSGDRASIVSQSVSYALKQLSFRF